MTRAGLVQFSEKAILEWLDFEGGTIWAASKNKWGSIELLIEHEDMPELCVGDTITPILPVYQTETDGLGHIVKVERIEPAKGRSNE